MSEEKRQTVAYFRYSIIAPLHNRPPGEPLSQAIARLAEKSYQVPGTKHPRKFSSKTIEEWFYLYRKGGIEFLKPKQRHDSGQSRKIEGQTAQTIEQMLTERPYLNGPTVLKELQAKGLMEEGEISLSSFYRFRKAQKLSKENLAKESFRAFAFENPQDCFQADVMYGPKLPTKKGKLHRTYLIAVIDDCTRVITHGQFYFQQDLPAFLDTLKQAMLKRGCPRRLFVDNGQIFRSSHLLRIAATLGIELIHSRAYRPQGKAKIERFFRTARDQFLSRVEPQVVGSLSELNSLFWAWLEGEYHKRTHRILEESPLDKWRRLSQFAPPLPMGVDLNLVFMHQTTRRVSLDSTFQIKKCRFEAPLHLAKEKVTVHYDPADLRQVFLSKDGKHQGVAFPLDREANCFVWRGEKPKEEKSPTTSSPKPLSSLYHLREKVLEERDGSDSSTSD